MNSCNWILHRALDLDILKKTNVIAVLKTGAWPFSRDLEIGVSFQNHRKTIPIPGRGSALGRRWRQRMGVDFTNVLKLTQNSQTS